MVPCRSSKLVNCKAGDIYTSSCMTRTIILDFSLDSRLGLSSFGAAWESWLTLLVAGQRCMYYVRELVWRGPSESGGAVAFSLDLMLLVASGLFPPWKDQRWCPRRLREGLLHCNCVR